MKKQISVKLKMTLWLTIFMLGLSAVLVGFMMLLSRSVAKETAQNQLKATVQSNIQKVAFDGKQLSLDAAFAYYHEGVSLLIYSQKEALLAGQLPVTFSETVSFENGTIRMIDMQGGQYYVLDVWIASGWTNGVWLRGLMEIPDSSQLNESLLRIASLTLPVFILLAAIGAYRIARRAFKPLDHINATAKAINEAKDLGGRIALPDKGDEFSQLAANFDAMFDRLERSFEAEKQFTSDASHELRTPVSIIKGACEFAEKYDETPEERQETIEMIHRQADRMSRTIQQLLNMRRMERGMEKPQLAEIDLNEVIESLAAEEKWDESRCHVLISAGVTAKADKEMLKRLVRNLVENGFKYGKENGNVWIGASQNERELLISVKDDGLGIAPEEQEKVWERFYQSDVSRSDDSGAGLGLSMVKQIAQLHGGYMTLESELGKGSTFTLHLPLEEGKNS